MLTDFESKQNTLFIGGMKDSDHLWYLIDYKTLRGDYEFHTKSAIYHHRYS